MEKEEKLTPNDYLNLAIETAISSIPHVGSILQTAYFGAQNEKRFKRVENFYQSLGEDVQTMKDNLATKAELETVADELSDFIEATNSIIESQSSISKKAWLHNAFLKVLTDTSTINWSQTRYFMSVIKQIDDIDAIVLFSISKLPHDKWAVVNEILKAIPLDKFLLIGLLERLASFGLLEKRLGSINMKDNGTFIDTYYRITELGKSFISFTVEPPAN